MQSRDIDKGGLLIRLARIILAIGVVLASTTAPAGAANPFGLAPDPTFGTNGFTALPAHASTTPGAPITPIGIVRLDIGGGYIAATLQRVSAIDRIVLTRYAENGQFDIGWGTGGSQMPGLPPPLVFAGADTIKLVAGRENGQDIFYVAFTVVSGGISSVAVAKFLASGAFDASFGFGGYATSTLPVGAPIGLISVQGAAFTEVFGLPVLVVALGANGGRLVFTRAHGLGTAALSDQGGGSSILIGAVPQVMQMRALGPDRVEVVGAVNYDALYVDYHAGTLASSWRMFDMPCQGANIASSVDAAARPAAFGGDTLVYGRAVCDTGSHVVVARIANVATPAASLVWWRNVEADSQCNGGVAPCPTMLLAHDDAMGDHALVVTPLLRAYPVRLSDGVAGTGAYLSDVGSPSSYPQPSTYRGAVLRWPRLVGYGQVSLFDATRGITGLRFDSLFADGFE
ncbi:MAG TPA: hypothetical protein VJ724_04900 [Tahibacter sp.]|nr:hypothetical protein [Tahibacter sp.]